ncbi:DUF2182 domain-containing protein [Bordetella sp. BOR01]|uniref:DUF2182 domain-containing protein n=1 Tax=Bordetella sp. BOR01 TaxID=2854779 RepID=UPI001C476811|nr:DUF2182 domain-containing protein [Bordetella sp. BOR01]MBV7483928.1 DUF2182 domain-containing protein [Bordetella sp. BOR01]
MHTVQAPPATLATARRLHGASLAGQAFPCLMALLFVAAAAATAWHSYVPALDMLPLCGPAMPAPAAWLAGAASFVGMWTVMTVAMMLPALAPVLCRYRQAISPAGGLRASLLAGLAGMGYFCAWALLGMAIYPVIAILARAQAQWPALAAMVPAASGALLVVAGTIQCSRWKARYLALCRQDAPVAPPACPARAWRHGWRLGRHCLCSCAGYTVVLLGTGIMDLRAMVAVAAAITVERLAPAGPRWASGTGAAVAAIGLALLVQAGGAA